MTQFAKKLREKASQRGMSVQYLSDFTGLDPSYIRRLMTGEKTPSRLTIIKLSLALCSCPERWRQDKVGESQTFDVLILAFMSDAAASSL